MKVGDLVRHMFDGRWDEVGIVTEITPYPASLPGGMVKVLWNVEHTHRNDRLYRMRSLGVVSN